MKSKEVLSRKSHLAFGAAILVLLGLGATSYRDVAEAAKSDQWVRHTREVLESLQYLSSAMARIESSYHGYVLTGKEFYVESSRANMLIAEQSEATIGRMTEDNPLQRSRVPDLEKLTAATATFGERVINLRRAHGFDVAADAIRSGAGHQVMDEFQTLVRSMEDEERRLLVQRIAGSKRHVTQTKSLLFLGTLLGVLIAAGAGWTVRRDSAARDLAEAALREGEERFRTMANNISQLAWMADEKGSIFWYNQRWFDYSGTTLEEMFGWGWQKVHHPDHVQRVVDKMTRCFQTGDRWEDTSPLRSRDGNYRWFLSQAVPIHDAEGKVLRWFGTSTDITESREAERHLVQMESQATILRSAHDELELRVNERTKELAVANQVLERSNIELQQFAYVASHDLQSPLRSISGFVQLLKSEYKSKLDEQAHDWIRRTVEAIEQMQTLIRDVLDYSGVDSRARPFAPVPSLDVFNDAVALLESSICDAGGQVDCGELPVVIGDRSQLVQLMQNLIGNGLKYHGEQSPHVHVSAEHHGNEWTFSVRDNGIGIAPKHYERIFEIFKRLHDQKEYPGTGIGLAVCRRVVTRHGGRIWLESEAGSGSVFHFTLPEGADKTNDQRPC